ncbi:MFS transporter [uncultured Odoribacter sp.]|uniref:MFS transporter n=1 Tax=uncultured Odoribacter sp. TaxID=876416 RepID=UPI00261E90C5|nr:MFS transporter [uncultured Odoribacter sp.]
MNTTTISNLPESRKDTLISICVFLSGFSCFAQLYYFQPLLPDLAREFLLSASHSSLAVSFSTLGMVFGLITTMFIADRIPRKKLISMGLLTSSVFSVAASFSPVFWLLILLSAAKGFLLSGATSVSMAYIAEEVSEKNKARIMALYIAGNALGGMSGRFITSWIGAVWSWRIASVSIGLICALFALLFLLFSPRSTHFFPRKESLHSLIIVNARLITSKALVPFYLTGGLILGVFVSLYNYMGFYLLKPPFNFPEYSIHYIYLMYTFGMFGSVATVRLTRHRLPVPVLKSILLLSAASILFLYIPGFLTVGLGLAIFTFNFFVIHVLCNRIVSEYNLAKRSVTISIYLLTYYLGSSLLGWATGLLLDAFGWPYFLAGLILLLLLNYAIIARRNQEL